MPAQPAFKGTVMRLRFFSISIIGILLIFLFTGCASLVTGETAGRPVLPVPENETPLDYVGEVKNSLTNWNWFFQSSAEERRALLEQTALAEAVELYGDAAVIKPEVVNSSWNPASLLMLLGAAGFVEDTKITASVWLPASESIPEPAPAARTGIRWVVVPATEYTNSSEFTTVEYKTADQLRDELNEAFAGGKLSETDLAKKHSRLPKAGTVFITYGRTELTNAISRWFNFTLFHNGKQIFKKRGTEDIPYVYGNDKLWWNDMSYKVEQEWTGSLELLIEDKFQNKIYEYKIIREVYIISDSE
jgi:hypothetical protein